MASVKHYNWLYLSRLLIQRLRFFMELCLMTSDISYRSLTQIRLQIPIWRTKWQLCKAIAVSPAFIFHLKCYSILHFALCQLLPLPFLLIYTILMPLFIFSALHPLVGSLPTRHVMLFLFIIRLVPALKSADPRSDTMYSPPIVLVFLTSTSDRLFIAVTVTVYF